jgi:hypothetical protein
MSGSLGELPALCQGRREQEWQERLVGMIVLDPVERLAQDLSSLVAIAQRGKVAGHLPAGSG